MLPKNFDLEELDLGMTELVVTLNRIPGIDSMTNCHGHVIYAPPILPVKGGWFYFLYKPEKHKYLVDSIIDYSKNKRDLNTEVKKNLFFSERSLLSVIANFEYEGVNPEDPDNFDFRGLNESGKEEFLGKMKKDWQRHLRYWGDITSIFNEYIIKNISNDIESLPFRYSGLGGLVK